MTGLARLKLPDAAMNLIYWKETTQQAKFAAETIILPTAIFAMYWIFPMIHALPRENLKRLLYPLRPLSHRLAREHSLPPHNPAQAVAVRKQEALSAITALGQRELGQALAPAPHKLYLLHKLAAQTAHKPELAAQPAAAALAAHGVLAALSAVIMPQNLPSANLAEIAIKARK